MRNAKTKDWTHLYPKYAGRWGAFAQDNKTVISSAKSFKTTINKASENGFKNPLTFKVPQEMLPSYLPENLFPKLN